MKKSLRHYISHFPESQFVNKNVMTYNPEIHHRRSIRIKLYDYSQAGVYFVPICSWKKENIFGKIINGEMLLNEYGEIVNAEWTQAQVVRQYVQIDEYVIMPNHFHEIMVINGHDSDS